MTEQKTQKQKTNAGDFWQVFAMLKNLVDENKITPKQAKKIINKI